MLRARRYLPKARVIMDAWIKAIKPPIPHIVTDADTPKHKAVRTVVTRYFTSSRLKQVGARRSRAPCPHPCRRATGQSAHAAAASPPLQLVPRVIERTHAALGRAVEAASSKDGGPGHVDMVHVFEEITGAGCWVGRRAWLLRLACARAQIV
jgi:hypothetical protein